MDNPFNSKVTPTDQVSEVWAVYLIGSVFGGHGCESIYDGYICRNYLSR